MRTAFAAKLSLVFLSTTLVFGCVSTVAVSKTPKQIVIADEGGYGGLKHVTNQAMDHCKQYGAGAVLVTSQDTNQQSGMYPLTINGVTTYHAYSSSTPVYTFLCDPDAEYIQFEIDAAKPVSEEPDTSCSGVHGGALGNCW